MNMLLHPPSSLPPATGEFGLGRIEALLARTIGLDAASVGRSHIRLAVEARLRATGIKVLAHYGELVARGGAEMQALIEQIVVPETWFFRDRQPFAALAEWGVGQWRPANPNPGSVLRALSMPCSTGEEPYSIAMALLDAGLPPGRFVVEAVDISHPSLQRAGKACFGRNSFREEPLGFRERHFNLLAPDLWQLKPEIRRQVRFRQANLLDPSFASTMAPKDVIFCRNLLIYLDARGQRQLLKTVRALLAPGGIVFAGHAEAYLFSRAGFQASPHPMAFGFHKEQRRRSEHGEPLAVSLPPKRRCSPSKPASTAGWSRKTSGELGALAALPSPRRSEPPQAQVVPSRAVSASLEECQRLADEGRLKAAIEGTEAWLQQHGPSARAYYLLGLAKDASNHPGEAALHYRKALYLDPEHAGAMAQLALLAKKEGDPASARRLKGRLRRLEARQDAVGNSNF